MVLNLTAHCFLYSLFLLFTKVYFGQLIKGYCPVIMSIVKGHVIAIRFATDLPLEWEYCVCKCPLRDVDDAGDSSIQLE